MTLQIADSTAREEFYGKNEAKVISGLAIVMMLIHHFFGFPGWLHPNISFGYLITVAGLSVPQVLAAFGKLCVALFAFNSGYALWKSSATAPVSYRKQWKRGFVFLLSYWVVCLLFLGYACVFGKPLPSAADFFLNGIGLRTGPEYPYVNVAFAWYVTFYLVWLTFSPLLLNVYKRSKHICFDIFLLLIISLAVKQLIAYQYDFHFLVPTGAAITGLLCAKHDVFQRLTHHLPMSLWKALCILMLLIILRQGLLLADVYSVGFEDGVFSGIFIYTVISMQCRYQVDLLNKMTFKLGDNSMNIWYLHGLIFVVGGEFLQYVFYFPHYWLCVLLWSLGLLWPITIVSKYLQKTAVNFLSSFDIKLL